MEINKLEQLRKSIFDIEIEIEKSKGSDSNNFQIKKKIVKIGKTLSIKSVSCGN